MTDKRFEAVVRTYADTIYRVALHALGSRADAEDVMQTVLLKLYERQEDFEGPDHLKHWLLRLAVNESRSLLRSAWRRRRVSLEDGRELPVPEDPAKAELLEAVMALEPRYRLTVYLYYYEGCSVAETARALGARLPVPEDPAKAELLEAVMALEPRYRLTVYLYYYEGCSVAETARALGARPSTVQTWLHRARQRLRADLAPEKNEEGYGYVRPQILS